MKKGTPSELRASPVCLERQVVQSVFLYGIADPVIVRDSTLWAEDFTIDPLVFGIAKVAHCKDMGKLVHPCPDFYERGNIVEGVIDN